MLLCCITMKTYHVAVQSRGTIALPVEFRKRYKLDEPGAHLDLVGAFNLKMRKADDEALLRAQVYIDTPAARSEGGDVAVALQTGAMPERLRAAW